MTSIQPVYPSGILTWTDRVDDVTTIDATDVNTLAADLISVENTLGTNIEIESSPPTGLPITYTTTSARISDAMNNAQLPSSTLSFPSMQVPNTTQGQLNTYNATYDPYGLYNGTDMTVTANGWWFVSVTQTWAWSSTGYSHLALCLNGTNNIIVEDVFNWQFPGNSVTGGVPGRWQQFGLRTVTRTVTWEGLAHAGDRFSGLSENGTSNAYQAITNMYLKSSMKKTITGNFTSG